MIYSMSDEVTPVPAEAAPAAAAYKDDDLVYVDPGSRTVVGIVEWNVNGRPKPLQMKEEAPTDVPSEEGTPQPTDKRKLMIKRPRRIRYYPWGTYRSMKNVYKIEGKQPRQESTHTLDQVIEKALQEPFWD
jgi:hypothetical protein